MHCIWIIYFVLTSLSHPLRVLVGPTWGDPVLKGHWIAGDICGCYTGGAYGMNGWARDAAQPPNAQASPHG